MASLKLPALVGDMRLLEVISEGPVATVYLAARAGLHDVTRLCAVKLIDMGTGHDQRILARFMDEARLLVQLDHHGVCRVFDAGRAERYLYIAMEHVHGRDLVAIQDALVERDEMMTVELAILLVREVLEALDYSHRLVDRQTGVPADIVHGGLCPKNILVGFDGQTKVLDFGKASSSISEARTRSEEIQGALSYMSPEQLQGDPVDARADLFAAAVILTELILGARFVEPAPSTKKLFPAEGSFRPKGYEKIDALLRASLDRALAPDPRSRFASCAAFADALRDYQIERRHRVRTAHLQELMRQLFEDEREESARRLSRFSADLDQATLFAPTEADDELVTIAVDIRVSPDGVSSASADPSDVFAVPSVDVRSSPSSTGEFADRTLEVENARSRGRTFGVGTAPPTEAQLDPPQARRVLDEKRTEIDALTAGQSTSGSQTAMGARGFVDPELEESRATMIVNMSDEGSAETSLTKNPARTGTRTGPTHLSEASKTAVVDNSKTVVTAHSMTGPLDPSALDSEDHSAETAASTPRPDFGEATALAERPWPDSEGSWADATGDGGDPFASSKPASSEGFDEATIQNDPKEFAPVGEEQTLLQEIPPLEDDVPSVASTDYELIGEPGGERRADPQRQGRPVRPKPRR